MRLTEDLPDAFLGIPFTSAQLSLYGQQGLFVALDDYIETYSPMTKQAMADYPDLAGLVRNRYRVVVLDEYQDTNPAQRILLTSIFGTGFPVIAVGDEDQTIYEWRGASAENFEKFGADENIVSAGPRV